jgi:REP element-mobilizing transposase RayT
VLIQTVEHRHRLGHWWAHLFLLMPDHVHALISFPRTGAGLAKTVSTWKGWTAKTLKIEWQCGFFDHRLRGDEAFDEKAHYIRMNPVRAGLVTDPSLWPHVWTPDPR